MAVVHLGYRKRTLNGTPPTTTLYRAEIEKSKVKHKWHVLRPRRPRVRNVDRLRLKLQLDHHGWMDKYPSPTMNPSIVSVNPPAHVCKRSRNNSSWTRRGRSWSRV